MKRSPRELSIDMVISKGILKNNHITPFSVLVSYSKQVWDCLKHGLGLTVLRA